DGPPRTMMIPYHDPLCSAGPTSSDMGTDRVSLKWAAQTKKRRKTAAHPFAIARAKPLLSGLRMRGFALAAGFGRRLLAFVLAAAACRRATRTTGPARGRFLACF